MKGIPPVVIATVHRKLEVLKVLVTAGALVNEADRTARTPLHYAAGKDPCSRIHCLPTQILWMTRVR